MNKELAELYSDYLLSSFGAATATGLSDMLEGEVSHDRITRFLSKDVYDVPRPSLSPMFPKGRCISLLLASTVIMNDGSRASAGVFRSLSGPAASPTLQDNSAILSAPRQPDAVPG